MMNNEMTKSNEQNILVGIDVGSTTTKIVAVDANDRHQLLFSDYAKLLNASDRKCDPKH